MLTNEELAVRCKDAGQCRFCKPAIKVECLQNECWKADYPKDRMPPSVYYGLIEKLTPADPADEEERRRKWFQNHGIAYQPPRKLKGEK
jgi:hypothetical protein